MLASQLAETLYLQMLRKAQQIVPSMDLQRSAKKIKKEEILVAAGSPLFRGALNLSSGDATQVRFAHTSFVPHHRIASRRARLWQHA